MEYRFVIKPERDACNRCLRVAFKGEKHGTQYNIHEVDSRDETVTFKMSSGELIFEDRAGEGRTGILHLLCRCKAFVFEVTVDGSVIYQSKNKFGLVDGKSDKFSAESIPGEVSGEENSQNQPAMGYGEQPAFTPDRQLRQRYRTSPAQTRRSPGNPFATIISNVASSLINSIYKLFTGGKGP